MTDIDDTEEDSFDTDEVAFSSPVVVQRRGSKVDKADAPIENASDIPLFEDADRRGLRSATYLRVIKLDKPGAGFKGNIPLTSTLETIGQLHGDGVYNIEACNHKHQVLRSKENIRISLDATKTDNPNKVGIGNSNLELVSELRKGHTDEVNRLQTAIERTSKESLAQSKDYVEMVKSTTEAAARRDREHMAGVNKNQQDFFANLMTAQSQMFQQTMAMITVGHQQTMESMRLSSERESNGGNSNLMVLMKGLEMGRDMGASDDSPDWLKALDKGGSMMQNLLLLKNDNSTKQLPTNANTNTGSNPGTRPPTKKQLPLSRNELLEIIRLKKALNAKGIDFEDMVKQTRERISEQAITPEDDLEDNEPGTAGDKDEESEQAE